MKILGLMKADEHSESGAPPSQDLLERMGNFVEEATKAGVLLAGDGLQPSRSGKRVELSEGKLSVIDGPFTETKELVASYVLMQVQSIDEAVEWTRRFLDVLGQGRCELRPILEFTDFPPELQSAEVMAKEAATRERMQENAAKS